MANLTLTPIIDLQIDSGSILKARKGFNVALILGSSSVIPDTERVRYYTSPDAMIEDGFEQGSPEYKAAKLYFSANLKPSKVAVGRKLDTDTDLLTAAIACRAKDAEWYILIPCGASKADCLAIADWAESATPDTVFAYTTHDENCLSDVVSGDANEDVEGIFKKLKAKSYRRSIGLYNGNDSSQDSIAALMGYACGANRGTNNSAYTLAYKSLPGVETDDLTETQVRYVAGSRNTVGVNGNVYVNRAGYNIIQQGRMADGVPFDEVINLDMLKNDITLNVMDLLTSRRKIGQTNADVASIINVISEACEKYVNIGFIAPGKWNGDDCLDLANGDMLPLGYRVMAEKVEDQSQADRENRLAPPIYVCIKLAGAIEFVTIDVHVNR